MKKIALMAAAFAMTSASFAEEAVVVEETAPAYENAFDTFYFGLGMGGSFVKYDAKIGENKFNEKANRFIGSAVLGAGKTFKQKFYVGAEILADFTKAKTKKVLKDQFEVKYQGITPQFDIRLGYVNPCWNTLFYGKVGVAYNKAKARHIADNKEYSKNKAGFVLGLGAEKMFCKKFSVRLEGDYNFGGKYKNEDNNVKTDVKFNKGFTARAIVVYNVKY